MKLFEVRELKKYYESKKGIFAKELIKSVDGLNFELNKGEILGIVGESGCGKSTTAKLLIGIENPTSGEILYHGKERVNLRANELKEFRQKVSMIFQDPYSSLNPRWKVGRIIAEPLYLNSNLSHAAIKERVIDVMQKVGLKPEWFDRYAHQFSGGQRQRIGIARAIITHPEIIICDEPVSALDVSIQAQVLNLLLDLQEEFSLTYIFISHDLSVVRHICDRILVMNGGKIVESGSAEEIFCSPKDEFTKTLLNSIPKI